MQRGGVRSNITIICYCVGMVEGTRGTGCVTVCGDIMVVVRRQSQHKHSDSINSISVYDGGEEREESIINTKSSYWVS